MRARACIIMMVGGAEVEGAGKMVASLALVTVVVLTIAVSPSSSRGVGNITQTPVYAAGEGGYYCFRIPALLFTGKGTLLAFAEGRGQHTGKTATITETCT